VNVLNVMYLSHTSETSTMTHRFRVSGKDVYNLWWIIIILLYNTKMWKYINETIIGIKRWMNEHYNIFIVVVIDTFNILNYLLKFQWQYV